MPCPWCGECGAWWREASVLDHLGYPQHRNGQPGLTGESHRRAATVLALLGADRGEAMARIGLAASLRQTGRPAEAARQCENAEALMARADDRWGVAVAQYELALARHDVGDTSTVRDLMRAAADTFAVRLPETSSALVTPPKTRSRHPES